MLSTLKVTRSVPGIVWHILMVSIMVILLIPSMAGATGGNDWRLMVKSAACVKGPVVLLGEIADPIDSLDQRTWQTLSSIKLWKAATKPGRPVVVTREKLRKILKHYMGDLVNNLVLPSQLTVQTGGRVITGERLKARVVAFLTPRARDLSDNVEFKDMRIPMQIFFPNDYDTLQISMKDDLKPGRNQIRLHGMASDGKVVFRKTGTVFLNVWKTVPVAAKPLNRFERITKDKVSFRRVNLAYQPGLWDGTGGPWRMGRTLGRGQPFSMNHLESVPVIEKGERVTLVFRGRRVQLSIKAEALGEAGMGQQVAVRNLQSKKEVLATVVGDDMVVVR